MIAAPIIELPSPSIPLSTSAPARSPTEPSASFDDALSGAAVALADSARLANGNVPGSTSARLRVVISPLQTLLAKLGALPVPKGNTLSGNTLDTCAATLVKSDPGDTAAKTGTTRPPSKKSSDTVAVLQPSVSLEQTQVPLIAISAVPGPVVELGHVRDDPQQDVSKLAAKQTAGMAQQPTWNFTPLSTSSAGYGIYVSPAAPPAVTGEHKALNTAPVAGSAAGIATTSVAASQLSLDPATVSRELTVFGNTSAAGIRQGADPTSASNAVPATVMSPDAETHAVTIAAATSTRPSAVPAEQGGAGLAGVSSGVKPAGTTLSAGDITAVTNVEQAPPSSPPTTQADPALPVAAAAASDARSTSVQSPQPLEQPSASQSILQASPDLQAVLVAPNSAVLQQWALLPGPASLPETNPVAAVAANFAPIAKAMPLAANASKAVVQNSVGVLMAANQAQQVSPNAAENSSQPSSDSGDENKKATAVQDQTAAATQPTVAPHAVTPVDHSQNAAVLAVVPAPVLSREASVSGQAAKSSDVPATGSSTGAQTLSSVNSARLIQSVGQSEMRVGMHSSEFGNISISAFSTRAAVSAQISLDHSELARTLAAQLPEMQTRLGSNQSLDVRIGTSAQSAAQGQGSLGGAPNHQGGTSSSDRPRPGSTSFMQPEVGAAAKGSSVAGAATGVYSSRLDVTA